MALLSSVALDDMLTSFVWLEVELRDTESVKDRLSSSEREDVGVALRVGSADNESLLLPDCDRLALTSYDWLSLSLTEKLSVTDDDDDDDSENVTLLDWVIVTEREKVTSDVNEVDSERVRDTSREKLVVWEVDVE